MALSITIFLLLFVGGMLLVPKSMSGSKRIMVSKTVRAQKRARIVTSKTSMYERFRSDMMLAFEQGSIRLSWDKYLVLCVILSVGGALIGAAFDNMPLAAVLAAFLPVLFTQYIKIRARSYRSFLHMQIESSLGMITGTYILKEDIRTALEGCLDYVDAPLKDVLSACALEIYLGAHVPDAISHMRAKVDNRHWREWCDVLIECQADRNQMVNLQPIVQQLSALQAEQIKLDTIIADEWRKTGIMCAIAFGAPFLIRLMNADWYTLLTETVAGKITIASAYGVVFAALLYAARINKPLSMEV
ncbi:MAG TPA: hypothetical protein PKB13_06050 [Clostridia bacterium]|nr:hypothetical protein [Clostridia bacterium]